MNLPDENDVLRLAADDFEREADALARYPLGSAEYVRGIRACVQALRERADCPTPPAKPATEAEAPDAAEPHGADWSGSLPGEGPSCVCGYNGTPEDCASAHHNRGGAMNLPDENREAVAELLRDAGVGQVVRTDDHGGWDVRDVPPEVLDALPFECLTAAQAEHEGLVGRGLDAARRIGLAEGEARVRARVEAVLAEGPDTWDGYETHDIGHAFLAESVTDFTADLRAALDADAAETTGGGA